MDEMQLLGYIITAVITLGTFIGVVMKFIQPINELRITIQKLIDSIDGLKNDVVCQNKRIDKHGEEIDKIDSRLTSLEARINMYHKEG